MQTLSFVAHIPLVAFAIAFPPMVLFVEWPHMRTGDPAVPGHRAPLEARDGRSVRGPACGRIDQPQLPRPKRLAILPSAASTRVKSSRREKACAALPSPSSCRASASARLPAARFSSSG